MSRSKFCPECTPTGTGTIQRGTLVKGLTCVTRGISTRLKGLNLSSCTGTHSESEWNQYPFVRYCYGIPDTFKIEKLGKPECTCRSRHAHSFQSIQPNISIDSTKPTSSIQVWRMERKLCNRGFTAYGSYLLRVVEVCRSPT